MEEVETSSRSLKNRNGKHKFWSWGQATVCNRSTNRLKDTVSRSATPAGGDKEGSEGWT